MKQTNQKEDNMSFFINNNNPNRPGAIIGNPVNGICEKALIEVRKVFDACVSITTESGIVLEATNFNPPAPALPLTYISAETDLARQTTVSNVTIDRLESRPNFANVTATVTIPILITYRDANGVVGTAESSITVTQTSILYVPQPSLSPIEIIAVGMFSSMIGTFTSPESFTVTACYQIVLKVVADVDLLVPSYGYPLIPECQSGPEEMCPGLADLPLYPTALRANQ
jgi:hypothetical protein